jgi:ABC-2 type transport system ATP-binding protein
VDQAITIKGVTKTFGKKVAVRDLDLEVPRGGLCGFIGPNGAGKTTTLRMVMSIFFPDSGELTVLGKRSAVESKDRIGYLPEERGIYRKMKVGSFLAYMARIKGCTGPDVPKLVREWLERIELPDVHDKKCEELSKGMQQKVQFVATVLHDPDLLILDEPFSGLDPVNMLLLRDQIRALHAAGKTVIFSTHVMHQAEELCDQIFMMHEGRKVLDAGMSEIKARFDPRTILLDSPAADGESRIRAIPGIDDVRRSNGTFEIWLAEGTNPEELIRALVTAVPTTRVELRRATLEDVFVQIVQQGPAGDEASLRASLREGAVDSEDGA